MLAILLIYRQLFAWLQEHCRYQDLRHLVTLAWMVLSLIVSEQ